jgi:riboflavin kinase/FMN adenylyltransferase
MQIARQLQEITLDLSGGSCVTIGNFDGVHNGHRKLIGRMMAKAAKASLPGVVVTFCPHPLRVLVGPHTPPFITDYEKKLDLLEALGVDLTLMLQFTRELAALEPEEFVRSILVDGLNVKELVVGYDYSFGKGRKGHFELLVELGEKYGFSCERLDPVIIDGAVVSSTRIRDMIKAGDVWGVRPLMDRFYVVRGTVVHGKKRGGRLLGFPTANLEVRDELVPGPGVYAVWVEVDGNLYKGVTNIGYNPTFGNETLSVETYIMDFDCDIYGWELRLNFVHRLRDERKFSGLDDLMTQIRSDVELGRQILDSQEAGL